MELNLPQKKIVDFNVTELNLRFNDHSDVWQFNIKIMNEISNILNAKYIAFLQPTIGLEGVQSKFTDISGKDGEIVRNTLEDINYIENLRETYKKLKNTVKIFLFALIFQIVHLLLLIMFTAMQDIIIREEIKLLHLKFLRDWNFKINQSSNLLYK